MNESVPEPALLEVDAVAKAFTLHQRGGLVLPVFDRVDLAVRAGECVVLEGVSGLGKSTLLKLIYANYRADRGRITVRAPGMRPLDVTSATPRELVRLRRHSVGYVSQFLRVIPRVGALDIVAESLLDEHVDDTAAWQSARREAARWLERLRIPEKLWHLPPATFSGGEQQRINIARNMIRFKPLLLLDEPTASLDAANTRTVIELIREATGEGAAVVGIFHDAAVGEAVGTRHVDVSAFRSAP